MDDANYLSPTVAREARDQCTKLLEPGADVYRRAADVLSHVGGALPDDAPGRLYAMWGGLTDFWELEPERRPEAEKLMRDAAREFFAIVDYATELDGYLARWCKRLRIPD